MCYIDLIFNIQILSSKDNKYCHPFTSFLTSGNSRVEESQAHSEKTGSRAPTLCQGEASYI